MGDEGQGSRSGSGVKVGVTLLSTIDLTRPPVKAALAQSGLQ